MRKLLTTALLLSSLATTALANTVWLIGNFNSWGRATDGSPLTDGYTLRETSEGSGIFEGTFGTEKLQNKNGDSWLMFRIQRDDPGWDTWKPGSFGPTVEDHTSTAINHNSLPATYPVANGNLGNWIIPGYESGSITVVFNEKENSVKISGTDIIVSDYTMPEKLYIRGYLKDGI